MGNIILGVMSVVVIVLFCIEIFADNSTFLHYFIYSFIFFLITSITSYRFRDAEHINKKLRNAANILNILSLACIILSILIYILSNQNDDNAMYSILNGICFCIFLLLFVVEKKVLK